MFKLITFSLLVALVTAKPLDSDSSETVAATTIYHPFPSSTFIHEAGLAKVGDLIHQVPTSVSHQSSTIVHERANVVTPVVAPVVKTHVLQNYNAPLLRTYASAYPFSFHYPLNYYYQYQH